MPPGIFIPQKVIVHHSLTKDSGTVSWGAIRHYHTVDMKWGDIGYHAGVELVQSGEYLYYEALFGRSWEEPGAHTLRQNNVSFGICFVGNYDEVEPPEEMLKVGARVISLWLKKFYISKSQIFGHSDFAPKSCPGSKFKMERLLDMIVDPYPV